MRGLAAEQQEAMALLGQLHEDPTHLRPVQRRRQGPALTDRHHAVEGAVGEEDRGVVAVDVEERRGQFRAGAVGATEEAVDDPVRVGAIERPTAQIRRGKKATTPRTSVEVRPSEQVPSSRSGTSRARPASSARWPPAE
jgi:hypothetical protein